MESVRVTREEVQRFLSIEQKIGYGCGSGKGTDYGSGYGGGDGYGNGRGCGSGYSHYYGLSYACGDGFGSNSGYGYGDGVSNGSGNCDESGEGSGISTMDIKTFNVHIVDYIDSVPTIITNIHNNVASGFIIGFDMTLIPCYVAKAGNSFAHGKTLKDAVEDAQAKEMGEMPIEERIEKFIEVFGSLDSEHIGKEF